ncbi:MAG: GTP-binding protein [Bacteroidota bacterium]
MTKKIPVTVLSGFLGAGKTTYLNHIMTINEEVRYAIIENEFGEQSIDSELVIRPEDGVMELNNGCLCCTLNDNLYEILNTLFDRRAEFDQIIIEATGVANPAGLAAPFISHPAIKAWFPLSSIICLVDAELIEEQLKETEEAISQITYSDVLLINKTDLVAEKQLGDLKQKLQVLNPLAKVFMGNKAHFPKINTGVHHALFHAMPFVSEDIQDVTSESDIFPVTKPHIHHAHNHTEEVVSQTFVIEHPFKRETLYHQFFVYLNFQSDGLYRMKGLVWLEDTDKQYILQSVGKRLDFQEKRAWGVEEKKQSVVVFIGKHLKREGLEKLLNRCSA